MKAMLTLEGGLRIDAEDPADWELLTQMIFDADRCESDLADRLGGLIRDDAGAEDWREYVVPDLREVFRDELSDVAVALENAIHQAKGGPGPVWIEPNDAMSWYSTLNQARLALEEEFHFGQTEDVDPAEFPMEKRSAFSRSRIYCTLQSMLLEHVMK